MLWGVVADGRTGSVWKRGGLVVCPPLCSTRESRCFLGDPDTRVLPAESSHSRPSFTIRCSGPSGRALRRCPRAEGPPCVTPASCLAVGTPPAPPVVSGGVLTLSGCKGGKETEAESPSQADPCPASRSEPRACRPGGSCPPRMGPALRPPPGGSCRPGTGTQGGWIYLLRVALPLPSNTLRSPRRPRGALGAVPSWGAWGGWSLKLTESLCLPFPVCLGGPAW